MTFDLVRSGYERRCDTLAGRLAGRSETSHAKTTSRPDWSRAGIEPSLAEVLADPVVHLVLRRDGLTPSDLRQAVNAACRRLARGQGRNLWHWR